MHSLVESSIDCGPYVNVAEDGMVAAVSSRNTRDDMVEDSKKLQKLDHKKVNEMLSDAEQVWHLTETKSNFVAETAQSSEQGTINQEDKSPDATAAVRRCLNQISRQNRKSIWLLALIAIVTSWPLVGSALTIIFRKKLRNFSPATLQAIVR